MVVPTGIRTQEYPVCARDMVAFPASITARAVAKPSYRITSTRIKKRRLTSTKLHGGTSQKTELFKTAAVRTTNPTQEIETQELGGGGIS
jgi:hypothetical protein